ncbi:MAG: PorP/SprF family type IX secretion system membrane protein [Bacteroidota bacterium]
MRLRTLLILSVLLWAGQTTELKAQDVHYTLHNMAPIWLNPAKTGGFLGSVRVGGIYRGQWYGLNGAQTPTLFVDAPIIRGLRKQDWIGVGFSLISDEIGATSINTTSTGVSASYHFAVDKERNTVLTLGGFYGNVNYGFELSNNIIQIEETIDQSLGGQGMAIGNSEFSGGMPMPGPGQGPGGGNNNNNSYTDISAGLVLRQKLNDDTDMFEVGFGLLHLNGDNRRELITPERDTTSMDDFGGDNSRDTRERASTIHAHANLDLALSEKWRLMPTVFYQSSATNNSISLQGWVGRELPQDRLLRLGLGYRTNDAIKILIGFDAGQLQAAAAFDIIAGQPTTIDGRSINAFELSANYIFNITKKPEPQPEALCPRI